jgi:hypothetical protein
MYRHPQLNSPIQVVGDTAQQGLFDLLPIAACRDCPAKPALDDRDERLDSPPLTIGLPGKGPLALAARAAPRQARGWPPATGGMRRSMPRSSRNQRWSASKSSPALASRRVKRCRARVCATRGRNATWSPPGPRSGPAHPAPAGLSTPPPTTSATCGHGGVCRPTAGRRGGLGFVQNPWNPRPPCGTERASRARTNGRVQSAHASAGVV